MHDRMLPVLMALMTFVILVPWGRLLIGALLARGIGKRIRYDGPASHQVKSGTATMGGIYFLAGVTLCAAILLIGWGQRQILVAWLAMVIYAFLGAFDDIQGLKDSSGVGWLARAKFPVQWGAAVLVVVLVMLLLPVQQSRWPGGASVSLGWWTVPLLLFLLVASSNAVNFTDGLDGLAGGLAAIAFACFGALTLVSGQWALASFCFAVVGSLMAFLWYNVYPAQLFMGDLGSQALGAGLAVVAVLSGYWWLLPLVGLVFVAETLSIMIQVSYFKYTRKKFGEGRRVFRMAPLHHHFEMLGWSEVQITARFWLAGLACSLLGIGVVAIW